MADPRVDHDILAQLDSACLCLDRHRLAYSDSVSRAPAFSQSPRGKGAEDGSDQVRVYGCAQFNCISPENCLALVRFIVKLESGHPFSGWMIFMSAETESSLATRPSLLARLKDWSQQTAWREFDHDYAPLLRNVARRRSGSSGTPGIAARFARGCTNKRAGGSRTSSGPGSERTLAPKLAPSPRPSPPIGERVPEGRGRGRAKMRPALTHLFAMPALRHRPKLIPPSSGSGTRNGRSTFANTLSRGSNDR